MIDQEFIKTHSEVQVVTFNNSRNLPMYRLFDPTCDKFGQGFLSREEAIEQSQGDVIHRLNIAALEMRRKLKAEADRVERVEQERTERLKWYMDYSQYINESPEWQARRVKIFTRDNHTCKADMPGCTTRATHVHHTTYAHLKNEPLFELVAVCQHCHLALHGWEPSYADAT